MRDDILAEGRTMSGMNLKHLLRAGLVLLALLPLSGCGWHLFDPKGPVVAEERHLIMVAIGLMLIVVIPVIIMGLVFPFRYRESNRAADYKPNWAHSHLIEVIIWGGPVVIITILAYITWHTTHQLDPFRPLEGEYKGLEQPIPPGTKALPVEVISLDWKWLFIYPEQNVAVINELTLPVNQPIEFSITSQTVMNTISIPKLAGQIYAMPGMRTKLHLMGTEVGKYWGHSGNLSGAGFSSMYFWTSVVEQADFDQWIAKVKSGNQTLDFAGYKANLAPTPVVHMEDTPTWTPVTYYSSVEPGLFDQVIRQFVPASDKQQVSMNEQYKAGSEE